MSWSPIVTSAVWAAAWPAESQPCIQLCLSHLLSTHLCPVLDVHSRYSPQELHSPWSWDHSNRSASDRPARKVVWGYLWEEGA